MNQYSEKTLIYIEPCPEMSRKKFSGGRGKKTQAQGVGDNGDRGHGHGAAGEHRVQGRAAEQGEHPGGHRDADDIVGKGPEKILADIAHGRPA